MNAPVTQVQQKNIFYLLLKKKTRIGSNIFLGYSPEREDPGNKKFSLEKKNMPKIVSGYTADCLSLTDFYIQKFPILFQ